MVGGDSPVDADADQDKRGQKESESAEERENPARHVAGDPLHCGGPSDFDGHQKKRDLENVINILSSSIIFLPWRQTPRRTWILEILPGFTFKFRIINQVLRLFTIKL